MMSPLLYIESIFIRPSCVRSLLSLARPSRCASHIGCLRSAMVWCIYDDRRFDDANISRMDAERCTMKLRFTLTSFFIQGRMSRLSPMAISTVLSILPTKTRFRNAESNIISRWLEIHKAFFKFSTFSISDVSPAENFLSSP